MFQVWRTSEGMVSLGLEQSLNGVLAEYDNELSLVTMRLWRACLREEKIMCAAK